MNNTISYLPPLGEEYQHVETDNATLLHTDIYLLLNIQNLQIADRIADGILDRCNKARQLYDDSASAQSFSDSLKSAVPAAFSDDTLQDFGRFDQGLNAQKRKVERKLQMIDDYRSKLKSDKDNAALDKLNLGMRKMIEQLIVPFDSIQNDSK